MKQNKALNIFTGILATLLSIPLVIFTFSATITSTTTTITNPRTLINFVQNLNLSETLKNTDNVNEILGTEQLDADTIDALTNSALFKDLLTVYVEDITDVLEGNENFESGITAKKIKEIANENIDEITDFVVESSSEPVKREDVKKELLAFFDENSQELAESLPSAKELIEEIDDETLTVINFATGPMPTLILAGIALVFAALIYACRFRKFGALKWIGVDLTIVAVLTILLSNLIKSIVSMFATEEGIASDAIMAISKTLGNNLLYRGLFVLFLAIAFFVGYILLKKYVVNKKNLLPETTTENLETDIIDVNNI